MALTINLEEHHNYILLEIIGSIDANNTMIINQAMESAIKNSEKHLLLDCSQLQNINSEALKALLKNRRQMAYYRMIMFCNLSSAIASLMELSGITTFIPVISEIIEAETLLQELDFAQGAVPQQNTHSSIDSIVK